MDKLSSVRAELLTDYVTKFKLTDRVDENFFEGLARQYVDSGKYHEAALLISKFKFHSKFDLKLIITKLIDSNRTTAAK